MWEKVDEKYFCVEKQSDYVMICVIKRRKEKKKERSLMLSVDGKMKLVCSQPVIKVKQQRKSDKKKAAQKTLVLFQKEKKKKKVKSKNDVVSCLE